MLRAISTQAEHVDQHADQHDPAGVATVGERRDQQLRQEPGEEADADHDADRGLADAVLVAVVVDDREQHAVAGGEAAISPPKAKNSRRGDGGAGLVERPSPRCAFSRMAGNLPTWTAPPVDRDVD